MWRPLVLSRGARWAVLPRPLGRTHQCRKQPCRLQVVVPYFTRYFWTGANRDPWHMCIPRSSQGTPEARSLQPLGCDVPSSVTVCKNKVPENQRSVYTLAAHCTTAAPSTFRPCVRPGCRLGRSDQLPTAMAEACIVLPTLLSARVDLGGLLLHGQVSQSILSNLSAALHSCFGEAMSYQCSGTRRDWSCSHQLR